MRRKNQSKEPLTNDKVRTYTCFRCGNQGATQWRLCAYSRYWLVVCLDCDILLNDLLADFFNLPQGTAPRYEREARKKHAKFNRDYPLKRSSE